MIKKIFTLFKLARKFAISDALTIATKFNEPPLTIKIIFKIIGFSFTKRDKNKGKPTLVNLLGYKETLNFANNLKNKINNKIKNYGIKSYDLIQSVEFILNRKF